MYFQEYENNVLRMRLALAGVASQANELVIPLRAQKDVYLARISQDQLVLINPRRGILFSGSRFELRSFFTTGSVQLVSGNESVFFDGGNLEGFREFVENGVVFSFVYRCSYCFVASLVSVTPRSLRIYQNGLDILALPLKQIEFAFANEQMTIRHGSLSALLTFESAQEAEEIAQVLCYLIGAPQSGGTERSFGLQAVHTYDFGDISDHSISLGEGSSEAVLDLQHRSSSVGSTNASTTTLRTDIVAVQRTDAVLIDGPYDDIEAARRADILELGIPCELKNKEVVIEIEVSDAIYVLHRFGLFDRARKHRLMMIAPVDVEDSQQTFSLLFDKHALRGLRMPEERFAAFYHDFEYVERALLSGWARSCEIIAKEAANEIQNDADMMDQKPQKRNENRMKTIKQLADESTESTSIQDTEDQITTQLSEKEASDTHPPEKQPEIEVEEAALDAGITAEPIEEAMPKQEAPAEEMWEDDEYE